MNSSQNLRTSKHLELVYSHKVTRDELIKSLDSILNHYGCPSCGLNGWGVTLVGDPDPSFSRFSRELLVTNPAIASINSLANPSIVINEGAMSHG